MRSNISRVLQQGLTAALRENLPRTAVQLSASIDASATVLLERTRAPGFTFRSKELISLRTFASAAHPAEKQAPETSPSVQQSVPRPARQPRRQAPSPAPSQLQRAATDTSRTLRVEATYVGSRINVYDLLARPEFSSHYKRLHKGTAILALTDTTVPESAEADGMPLGPYLVATSYGSAVFFDVDAAAKEQWLSVLRSVAVDPVVGDKSYNEEYSVMVAPELTSWSQLEPECIRLQTLDLRNMQVVAQALAQSVALDYYSR